MATQTESTAAAIDELTHNVDVLTDDMTEVKGKLNQLTDEVAEVQLKLSELKDEVAEVQLKLSELTDEVAEVQLKLSELTDEVAEVQHKLSALKDEVTEVQHKLSALTDEVTEVKRDLNALTLIVKVIESNYVTKEEFAVLNGKFDALTCKVEAMPAQILLAVKLDVEQAFRAHTEMMFKTFATKEELANAVYQLTWRMAAFGSVLLSAGFAFARYL